MTTAVQKDLISRTLAQSRLGMWPVVAIVMAAAAPLTVIAGGATTGWAVTGVLGIPVAYLAVAVILGLWSVGYVTMSSRIVNSGALYAYTTAGLGRIVGVASSAVAVLAYSVMMLGLYGGFGAVASKHLADRFDVHVDWWICAAVAAAVIGVLGLLRVDLNGLVLAILLAAEIVVALVFAVVQIAHPAGGTISTATLAPGNLVQSGVGAALVIAVAGFTGFEGAANFSEESKDPKRTVPRATYLAVMFIGLLYGLCSWAMSVAAGPGNIVAKATSDSTETTFNLVRPYLAPVWLDAGHILFITSLFAATMAFHTMTTRYIYALGRERVLPRRLGTTNNANSAPQWASGLTSAFAAVVLAMYALAGWDPIVHLFFWLTVLGGLGVLIS